MTTTVIIKNLFRDLLYMSAKEPVAKNLRDMLDTLTSLKRYVMGAYKVGADKWAETFVEHKDKIEEEQPYYKGIVSLVNQMPTGNVVGRIKYAMGDYKKPPSPPPPAPAPPPAPELPRPRKLPALPKPPPRPPTPPARDQLKEYVDTAIQYRKMSKEEKARVVNAIRAYINREGKSELEWIGEETARQKIITKAYAKAVVARAEEVDAERKTAVKKVADTGPHSPFRGAPPRPTLPPITSGRFPHPTTGGGGR
jgi:hypothetical protein